MYCLRLIKEVYVPNITEKEAAKMLKDLVDKEYKNADNKTEIESELQLCL